MVLVVWSTVGMALMLFAGVQYSVEFAAAKESRRWLAPIFLLLTILSILPYMALLMYWTDQNL